MTTNTNPATENLDKPGATNTVGLPLIVDNSEEVVEDTSNTFNYIMLAVGAAFFLLAIFINFYL